MNTFLFIFVCVLSIVVVIIFTFVSSAIHKRDLCRKSPYYHCDTSWICCKEDNCDTSGLTPSNSYKTGEQFYGTNAIGNTSGQPIIKCQDTTIASEKTYYQACILPVQVITKELNRLDQTPIFDCLYDKNVTCPSAYQSYMPSNYNLVPGQCCYQQFDPVSPAVNNTSPNIQGQFYPSTSGSKPEGNWNTTMQNNFSNNYTSPTYSFKSADTTNNSCNNSFFGAPKNASTSYTPVRYLGCPS